MILYRWRGAVTNFGDELNTLLWPALLPGFFDADPAARFLGIGSVLDQRHGVGCVKVVAGAGYGGYEAPPVPDRSWVFHWVRGPRTARLLGLDPSLGLGDPASLLPLIGRRAAEVPGAIGFMPHFESLARGHWADAAAMAGMTLLDPRADPAVTLAGLAACRLVISEALHGVIVADALRIPWIAVLPLMRVHRAKWHDWADSLGLHIAFRRPVASSWLEQLARAPLAATGPGRRLLDAHAARLRAGQRQRMVQRAAAALRAIAGVTAQLSADAALARGQARMQERIEILRRCPLRAALSFRDPGRRPSALRCGGDIAYHAASIG